MAVIDLLHQSVQKKPDKKAVIAQDGEVTFRELDAASSRIASELHAAGVQRGDKVALVLANDQACLFNAGYFGIHKLGAVPVPINTRWPCMWASRGMASSDSLSAPSSGISETR